MINETNRTVLTDALRPPALRAAIPDSVLEVAFSHFTEAHERIVLRLASLPDGAEREQAKAALMPIAFAPVPSLANLLALYMSGGIKTTSVKSGIDAALDYVVERMEAAAYEAASEAIDKVKDGSLKSSGLPAGFDANGNAFWALVCAHGGSQVLRMGSDRRYPAQPVVVGKEKSVWQCDEKGTPSNVGIAFGWRADPFRRAPAKVLDKLTAVSAAVLATETTETTEAASEAK